MKECRLWKRKAPWKKFPPEGVIQTRWRIEIQKIRGCPSDKALVLNHMANSSKNAF